MIITTVVITSIGDYYTSRPCAQLQFATKGDVGAIWPECVAFVNGTNPSQMAVVHADFNGRSAEIGAALGMSFGMALWLSIAIHAIGIEFYVRSVVVAEGHLLTSQS